MENSTKSEDANSKDERWNLSIKITNSTLTCMCIFSMATLTIFILSLIIYCIYQHNSNNMTLLLEHIVEYKNRINYQQLKFSSMASRPTLKNKWYDYRTKEGFVLATKLKKTIPRPWKPFWTSLVFLWNLF